MNELSVSLTPERQPESELPGLYVHVPFCLRKCLYCSFYSETDAGLHSAWIEALGREAALFRDRFPAFGTFYVGGGTPSLLSEGQLASLVESVRRCFPLAPEAEATIEVNPDDITISRLRSYRDLGFNRISIGVQSFHDAALRFLGRRHTAQQATQALEAARSCGFTNLSMDLIYGLPCQSLHQWMETLKRAAAFGPEHLSCYQLTYEDGTPLGRMRGRGRIAPLEEETEQSLFVETSRFLEDRGFLHYEISNFARSQARFSRHNLKYWRHVPYLGLGPSAHSFGGLSPAPYRTGTRWWNVSSVERYCDLLLKGQSPVESSENLTPEQIKLEKLFLGLRTREGVSKTLVDENPSAGDAIDTLKRSGLIMVEGGRILPTKQGFAVADRLPLYF